MGLHRHAHSRTWVALQRLKEPASRLAVRQLHRLPPSHLLCNGWALHYPAVLRVTCYAPG